MTTRLLLAVAALSLAPLARAQEGQDPKQPAKKPGEVTHDDRVRLFPEIYKTMEPKFKEWKAFKCTVVVSTSDPVADQTEFLKGEAIVRREEKKVPKLFWKAGTPKQGAKDDTEIDLVQRSVYDGDKVTLTDERDPKDLRYLQDKPTQDARLLAQEIIASNGKDLDKTFDIRPIADPVLAKTERTISPNLDDRLENKEGSDPNNPNAPKPPAENKVEYYAFELSPKPGPLQKQIGRILLQMDSQTFLPVMIRVTMKESNYVMSVMISNPTKIDPKDAPDSLFTLDLTGYKSFND